MSFLDKTIEIQPAYGRNYKTIKSLKADWQLNKDFSIRNGPYMSKDDIEEMINDNIETIYIKINHKNIYIVRFCQIQKGYL